MAWFPATESGRRRLETERRVLHLLADRCSFRVPRLLLRSDNGFDVRQMVPGGADPWTLFQRCKVDTGLARKIGRSVGAILFEQHTKICQARVNQWLSRHVSWPLDSNWIRDRLRKIVDDADLLDAMRITIERYDAVRIGKSDEVLIHGDLGLHNLAVDPETMSVNGVFDYGDAAWADRHHDFRYLIFDIEREDMLDAALAVYEPAIGRALDRERIRLYNAMCAICYLAFRLGTPADRKSCGRTLEEDLDWVRVALARLEW